MRVIVLAVGRCRDRVIIGQWDDYARRLPWNLSLVEINDADGPAKKQREAQKLLSAVPQGALVIALDERGKTLDSRGFAGWIERQRDEGRREMALIIGGADGLDVVVRLLEQSSGFLSDRGLMVCEVGCSAAALQREYPAVPFVWLDLPQGGEGVFVLDGVDLPGVATSGQRA